MIDELITRNGSTVSTITEVNLDGTSDILPLNQVVPLFEANPALRRACRDGRVVPTVTEGEGTNSYTGPTETLSVLALDTQINIKTRARPPRNFNQGRQGRRPGFGQRPSDNQVDTQNITTTPNPSGSQ
ncbi:unnamed protein product [Lymnaea stagnalis]|uniref:Uncharacterized protein n=1 Tax=Lymnaea stagnalis TaxID=6523 RepID=A0AAV2IJ63_LYMST